jgi:hypothetical protein
VCVGKRQALPHFFISVVVVDSAMHLIATGPFADHSRLPDQQRLRQDLVDRSCLRLQPWRHDDADLVAAEHARGLVLGEGGLQYHVRAVDGACRAVLYHQHDFGEFCNVYGACFAFFVADTKHACTSFQCWLFLLWVFDPRDAQYIPQIVYDQKQKISSLHVAVVSLTLLTIFLWASFTVTSVTFGDLGIISLMFMVSVLLCPCCVENSRVLTTWLYWWDQQFVMFGSGMLSQFDFNSFSWHILFLIGGGNVLGEVSIEV